MHDGRTQTTSSGLSGGGTPLTALRCLSPKQKQAFSRLAAAATEQFIFRSDDQAMPAIVIRARQDARCRLALARLGYFKVRSAYARHKREGRETFVDLDQKFLAPTMEFVGDWLREERKQIVARARWPFLMTMLATILVGVAFMTVASVLG